MSEEQRKVVYLSQWRLRMAWQKLSEDKKQKIMEAASKAFVTLNTPTTPDPNEKGPNE